MKTLLIMRHAKSSWKHPTLSDFERPLNKRGKRAAPLMGSRIKSQGLRPGAIISSSAVRARETAEAVTTAGGFNAEPQFLDNLYHAAPSQ